MGLGMALDAYTYVYTYIYIYTCVYKAWLDVVDVFSMNAYALPSYYCHLIHALFACYPCIMP